MRTNHSQSLSVPIIVRRNHPTFAGCNVLASVEAETGHVSNRTNSLTIKLSAVRLRRIFYYNNVFSLG